VSQPASVRIAHLSDVHLPLTSSIPWQLLNTKRVLGWLNWQRKRRFIHNRTTADAIVADLKQQAPDHILISGDLINIGLPAEYQTALAWLQTVGTPDNVSLVPGNHDTYVTAQAVPGLALWGKYMRDDAFGRSLEITRATLMGLPFPYVRRVGQLVIIGVNSGIPTPPGSAAGKVGPAQLSALGQLLKATGALGLPRLVMIHHPPVPGLATGHRALIDQDAFASTISNYGVELVIHGHNHTMTHVTHAGIPIRGVASASAAKTNGDEPLARYNLITFRFDTDSPSIEIETRGLQSLKSSVATISRQLIPVKQATDKVTYP
jgi:3',5'-cyclic AMP phosphodiesterase CpdA